jgi:hypothetical protein
LKPGTWGALLLAAIVLPATAADESSSAVAAADSAFTHPAVASKSADEEHARAELVWEWDPYYSDAGYNIPLTSKPIPTISSDSELEIYSNLIEGSLIPRYMLLEASVYPVPILGTYMKTHSPATYRQGRLGKTGINIFDSATAGFQEPWAVSVFLGNIAKLERPGEMRSGSNLGYTGYLVSTGAKHIKDNTYIDDNWYELEWKVKGKLDYPDEKMGWSFRVGSKMHSNRNIVDVMYLGLYRSNLDFRFPFLSWLMNSTLDIKVHLSQHGGQILREEFVVGKKYPMPDLGYTPTLDIGLLWQSPDEYAGVLRTLTNSAWTLVFRPSVEF